MRSTFYGLEIAKTGLFISQNQLDITGHNISNVDTPGYTRQRLSTAALPPAVGNAFIGTDIRSTSGRGVETINIEQVRNPFLDYQYRKENSTTTQWQTKEQYFGYLQALFNNELDDIVNTTGVSTVFSGFYNALQELEKAPSDKEMRVNLQQQAIKMTETMNYYYNRLVEQQDTLNQSVQISVTEINSLAKQIAQLNEQIYGYELSGARANDLRDQRNSLIDALSGLTAITTYEDTNGQMVIEVDGKNLVRHASYKQMAVADNVPNPLNGGKTSLYGVYWADKEGNPTANMVDFKDGAMNGYLTVRDGNSKENMGIPYVVRELNKLCQKMAADMNAVHEKGYTIPNNGGTTQTGIKFFHEEFDADGNSLVTAQNFRISDAIMNDVYNIAASDMPVDDTNVNDQKGNGKNMLAMCELITKKNASGNADNIDSVYRSILSDISVNMEHIEDTYDAQSVMKAHIQQQRKSISDVSLDEEMTNVVRYGHSYNACSRVISAIDEALDVLINRMGLVGRA